MTRANYCRQCGKRIETKGNKKFCSKICKARFNYEKKVGPKPNKLCKECGNPIPHSARRNTIYCCKECAKRALNKANNERRKLKREREKKPIKCKYCNDEFIPRNGNQKYCSKACCSADRYYRNRAKNPKEPLKKTCPICGCVFFTNTSKKRYCSTPCAREGKLRYDRNYWDEFHRKVDAGEIIPRKKHYIPTEKTPKQESYAERQMAQTLAMLEPIRLTL